MSGLPTVTVLLDDGTGTFPLNITSKCLLAEGLSYTRGRDDWQGGVTAGSLTLTLNNSDGRFTPGSTILGSPSPIKVDQRIRVKTTVNGITYTRFTGYVKAWPVAWPATVSTFSTVQLTATDAQARAERRPLRSVVEEEILADSPSPYYTLAEPEGATTAADTSGNQAPALTMTGSGTDVVFGTATGPGTDGLTAATFAAGKYLEGAFIDVGTGAFWAIRCAVDTSTASTFLVNLGDGGDLLFRLETSPAGFAQATASNIFPGAPGSALGATGAVSIADSATHDLLATLSVSGAGATLTLYVDGTLAATNTSGVAAAFAPTRLRVGNTNLVGSLSHVAVFHSASALTAGRVDAQADAALNGFAGESGTARITRTAGYANLALGTLDTSLTNVAFSDITGTSAWDAIQQATDAEMGVTFIDGSGNLIFHNRNRVPAKTAPDLTLAASFVTADAQPTQDDQQIINYLEVTSETTGVPQLARDTASETTHGRYDPGGVSYLVTTDAEALDRANWIVSEFKEPTTRFGTLRIDMYGMSALQASTVLTALEIDAWLRVTSFPSQTPDGTTVNVVIEGYTETISATEWSIVCNVVSQSLFSPVWILGVSALGVDTRLYV